MPAPLEGRCRQCSAPTTWPDPWAARALNRLCEPCQGRANLAIRAELSGAP